MSVSLRGQLSSITIQIAPHTNTVHLGRPVRHHTVYFVWVCRVERYQHRNNTPPTLLYYRDLDSTTTNYHATWLLPMLRSTHSLEMGCACGSIIQRAIYDVQISAYGKYSSWIIAKRSIWESVCMVRSSPFVYHHDRSHPSQQCLSADGLFNVCASYLTHLPHSPLPFTSTMYRYRNLQRGKHHTSAQKPAREEKRLGRQSYNHRSDPSY